MSTSEPVRSEAVADFKSAKAGPSKAQNKEKLRDKYDVLKDIYQAEMRLHQHIDGEAKEREAIASFQKELKALTDEAGKRK